MAKPNALVRIALVSLAIHLTTFSGRTAPTNELVPEVRREELSSITNSSISSWSRNWPPVAVIDGIDWTILGTQEEIMFGRVMECLPNLPEAGHTLLAISAPRLNGNVLGVSDAGGILFFDLYAREKKLTIAGVRHFNRRGATFGQSMARLGDLDGDGSAELLVGAPNLREPVAFEGGWFLFKGPQPWLGDNIGSSDRGGRSDARLGQSLADAGDVNRDGFPDVVVSAHRLGNELIRQGMAALFYGVSNGVSRQPVWSAFGEKLNAQFGSAVASAGDVNGDGFADVLVGAPRHSETKPDAGRVYLYLGSKDGLGPKPAWTADGPAPYALLGGAVAGLGDINGDGLDDVVVGAPGSERVASEWAGAALIYLGTSNGLAISPTVVVDGKTPRSMFGSAFATKGDLNGDGLRDLLVGAPRFSRYHANAGRIALYLGRVGGISAEPTWVLDGGQVGALCGTSASFVPDVNGDRCDEILIGSPRYTGIKLREGRVDLMLGSTNRFHATNWVSAETLTGIPPEDRRATADTPGWVWYGVGGGLAALVLAGTFLRRRQQKESVAAVEVERERLARDLHDDLGARLARISLLTELVRRDAGQSEEGKKNAQILSDTAREVLESMEQILWSVNPANDTLENLVTFIVQYAGPFFAPTGITFRHKVPSQLPECIIQPATRKNLFLTVKEALNNIVKHSGATEARLDIAFSGSCLTIVIEDNGCGLVQGNREASIRESAGKPRPRRGNGLGNMRARIEEIRGVFVVGAGDGGGTRVRIVVNI